MSTYVFGVTCPKCGTPLVHENSSPPMQCGYRSTAIAKCTKAGCRARWQIVTELMVVGRQPPVPQAMRESA